MSLAPGSRLGAYEIVALIGAGGMGEVYRAMDIRLNRSVAIKILQEKSAGDAEFKERFQREARAISSLEHPNICALYDIGEHEGMSFLVMQYLEGETLEARLHKGPLPVDEAVHRAIEIANALDTAHRHGIVHRDLKPGNIILSKSGAKLLDFGLAKTGTPALASNSTVPTTPANLTAHGTILGTVRYMAPEQLEGGSVDARTDIFAFGAIVYEMLTGKKAFEGKSQASLIASILDHEPPPVSADRPGSPRFLDHIIRRCLAKHPDARWQSARDLCDELQWIAAEQLQATPSSEARLSRRRPGGREAAAWTAAALGAVVATTMAFLYLRTPQPAREMRFDITVPTAVDLSSYALSPDGSRMVAAVAANGQRQLWVRSLDSPAWHALPGTDGADDPFWSPDSSAIGFFAGSKLKRIDPRGSLPQTLADASPRGGTWNENGVIVFAPNVLGALARIPASGGEPVTITKPAPQSQHLSPSFLPDGRHFVFYAAGPPGTRGIYLASLDSLETKRLVMADAGAAYVPSGWLIFIREGIVHAQRFDPKRGEMVGEEVAVANTVRGSVRGGASSTALGGGVSTSANGLIAYRSGSARSTQLVWTDRSGKTISSFGPGSDNVMSAPRLSPDGRRVAMFAQRAAPDVVLIDDARITRFTFDAAVDRYPVWSPDGRTVVFDSNRGKNRDLYSSTSPGGETLIFESPQAKTANDWSPDGRFILFQSNDPKTGIDLWVWSRDRNREPYVFLKTIASERRASFSPDGRWVTYLSNETGGRYEVYVRPFRDSNAPAGAPLASDASKAYWSISTNGGIQPRWNPNGKEVHYVAPDGKLMSVPVKATGDTLEVGAPVALFQPVMVGTEDVDAGLQYDIAADGRFLINTVTGDTSPITVIVNWTPPPTP